MLAQRRFQFALWIAVVEGLIILVSQNISWVVALIIAVPFILFYILAGRTLESDAGRQLAWIALHRVRQLRAALVVIGVLAVQMAVGEIQYRTKLPWWLVLTHVTLAAALWTATAVFVALLWRPGATRMT